MHTLTAHLDKKCKRNIHVEEKILPLVTTL